MILSKSNASVPCCRSRSGVLSVRTGLTASIMIDFENESDSGIPGTGRSSDVVLPRALMVPPCNKIDDRPTYPRSGDESPYCTTYLNLSAFVPEPETYAARLSVVPVSSSSAGAPVTVTGSENSTSMSIRWPLPYVPSAIADPTLVTNAGLNSESMWMVPLPACPGAPTANSVSPLLSRSPTADTEEPNMSPSPSPSPDTVARPICTVFEIDPSVFKSITYAEPIESTSGAPTSTSGVPSLSRSPTADTEEPKRSSFASRGPLAVEALISTVRFTVPSELRYSRWTAPAEEAPASSPFAPTAMSAVPSPSRSPTAARDDPKESPLASRGPLAVEALISTVRFTVPSELRYSRWTAPAEEAPASSPFAPTAMSAVPSPSRSPTAARDDPKESPLASRGPLAVEALISTVRFTVPSELR